MPVNLGNRVLPCLLVTDMRRSLEFYVGRLGFVQTGYYPIESSPTRTEVRRDGVAILLYTEAARATRESPSFSGAFYVFPESLDLLAEELRGSVRFAWGPEETELGFRELAIHDPDGYLLVFAERS